MRGWTVIRAKLERAWVGKVGFNDLELFPDPPDEMGLWPEGDTPSKSSRPAQRILSLIMRQHERLYLEPIARIGNDGF